MKRIIIIFIVIALLVAGIGAYFIYSPRGSAMLVDAVISHFAKSDAEFGAVAGNLAEKIILKDIVVEHPAGLPADSILKIQELKIQISALNLKGLDIDLNNARLVIRPGDDPIVIGGLLKDGSIELDIFSSRIALSDIRGAVAPDLKGKVFGVLSNADFLIKGPLSLLNVSGEVILKDVQYQKFILQQCPLTADLDVREVFSRPNITGTIKADAGSVFGQKTAVVNIEQAKILFSGDPKDFSFQCLGTSKVEKVEIKIDLRGTLEKPDLRLSSQPSLTQGRLLIMLATNRRWKGSEEIWDKKILPADTVKDFVDYFILSGSGNRLFREYGITEFSVQFEKDKKGVGIAKEISDSVEARYSVTKEQQPGEQPQTVQTIGGEVKLTDKISVEGQKEIRTRDTRLVDPAEQKEKGEVLLKYKTAF